MTTGRYDEKDTNFLLKKSAPVNQVEGGGVTVLGTWSSIIDYTQLSNWLRKHVINNLNIEGQPCLQGEIVHAPCG